MEEMCGFAADSAAAPAAVAPVAVDALALAALAPGARSVALQPERWPDQSLVTPRQSRESISLHAWALYFHAAQLQPPARLLASQQRPAPRLHPPHFLVLGALPLENLDVQTMEGWRPTQPLL